MLAAIVLTGALVTLTLQYVNKVSQAQRAIEQKRAVLFELQNLMEIVFAWDYDDIDARNIAELQKRRADRAGLANFEFAAVVDGDPDDSAAKHITISFESGANRLRSTASVKLSAWRFATDATLP